MRGVCCLAGIPQGMLLLLLCVQVMDLEAKLTEVQKEVVEGGVEGIICKWGGGGGGGLDRGKCGVRGRRCVGR